ncbi:hypothetical protein GCT13_29515 [Paraburkholderia sp. CNPSo 3157]|uniref:Uncharacterized protein n=1 Tax=Paraburkholderia franconis TaxID=2654983 RepID=A0A7X1NG34_9BURK|nr:hypothetical protein [Paraburkholderia franconis]MPW20896.1 hypothetical protein [Paraburkholderia franconis]
MVFWLFYSALETGFTHVVRAHSGSPKMATISELRTNCRATDPLLAIDGIRVKNVEIFIADSFAAIALKHWHAHC